MNELRWGLLSTTRMNRVWLPPLRASSRNELTAVARCDLERAQAYANSMHTDCTIKAAQTGKPVFCEKPYA